MIIIICNYILWIGNNLTWRLPKMALSILFSFYFRFQSESLNQCNKFWSREDERHWRRKQDYFPSSSTHQFGASQFVRYFFLQYFMTLSAIFTTFIENGRFKCLAGLVSWPQRSTLASLILTRCLIFLFLYCIKLETCVRWLHV